MSWNLFILFFILSFAGTVDSEYLGVPNAIKDFEVSESCGESCAKVIWRSFETDTVSFKVEFVPVHDGESFFVYANGSINEEWTFFGTPSFTKEFSAQVKGLKLNETYIVRVFAVNEQGQSPPSPAVIFSLDSHPVPVQDRHFLPNAPQKLGLSLDFTNGTKVTWEKVKYREDQTYTMSPIEYIIRYGDNKNTSLWKELKTNETWIVLDDLKNGTVYSAYVVAQEENRTSNRSYTIPIMPGEDMTGLPEPVLTIEPADKNGVFAPGDSITLKFHNGEPFFVFASNIIEQFNMKYYGARSMKKEFTAEVKGLKVNETYVVRVFALNERGQSPPSPALIYSLDPNWVSCKDRHSLPTAPQWLRTYLGIRQGIEFEWDVVTHREDGTLIRSPIEYNVHIFQYGDDKKPSLWKELWTNLTWIELDDLKKGIVYSAYVVAREKNSTSMRSYTSPIMSGEDMTGLPEPILTIEPADKNGVFAPGDSMTFKCSLPPNTNPVAEIVLILGRRVERKKFEYGSPFTFNATADKDVDTADCYVNVWERGARKSYISWKVKEETLDDEHLQKELIGANETVTSFKSI
ncbi:hypothetical protein CAEBREN_28647 [Caenorhabditis brenneri]|uniref:Fibronectin type-III domain-containing protein n=1 Tax=Caenorhabditis brenneri TaxID=135651 RepID=G0PC75_CAEBE|nr:hypothetical protein CAEBREN_28647 [Caenorhabditis brenneri]